VFPVRYELTFHILFGKNSVFTRLKKHVYNIKLADLYTVSADPVDFKSSCQ
jgi:hypothetical protein